MSLSQEEEKRVARLIGSVFGESGEADADTSSRTSGVPERRDTHEESCDHITGIRLLPDALESLALLRPSNFALLYGTTQGSVAEVGKAIFFAWSTGSSKQDLQFAIHKANNFLRTTGQYDLELKGLYMAKLEPEHLELYLDAGLGLQVVMGGRVGRGQEGELVFESRAISGNPAGSHFPVQSIERAQ